MSELLRSMRRELNAITEERANLKRLMETAEGERYDALETRDDVLYQDQRNLEEQIDEIEHEPMGMPGYGAGFL